MRALFVIGTRPEAIKLAPVIDELRRRADDGEAVEARICASGQQREMLDQAFAVFGIRPDHDLGVMEEDQTPTGVAATVLARLEPVLREEAPDWLVVQGDTTTVAAASLAAFYAGVRVGHVEAGLRSHDGRRPFPEELNRRVAGVVADRHFAPTPLARHNLLSEGVPAAKVVVTGNPVIDALHWAVKQPFDPEAAGLAPLELDRGGRRLLLVTAHRRESFGAPLVSICGALAELAARHPDARIVYPVHRNPSVWNPVHRLLGDLPNVTLVAPLDYLAMVHLLERAHLVLTDSGGLQEEAAGLGRPVLVLREVTERPEAVEAGTALLVGTRRERIVAEAERLLRDDVAYARMARGVNPFGDGRAAGRIIDVLQGSTRGWRAQPLSLRPANGEVQGSPRLGTQGTGRPVVRR